MGNQINSLIADLSEKQPSPYFYGKTVKNLNPSNAMRSFSSSSIGFCNEFLIEQIGKQLYNAKSEEIF
jgi:hypothetical protein